ncbi:methyl-accepting chemotaxis protein [Ciceribacter sp. RN22]|uniref:HAMP domain-containing methyl-accepting chemotaxis protein n=1 Tax=Ciceribacter sp. RN22 TaxID=2954932 RepID=UPI002093DDD6|nr:methyl-accepting chemotaxis protein [Ciceribacter sp. RN22]MCO6177320.1 methyl-accepting chemotaxis protein [Ciceribacter sp. RN22]
MKRPTVKTSLILSLASIAVITGGLAFAAISGISTIFDRGSEVADRMLPSINQVRLMDKGMVDVRLSYARHIMSVTPEAMTAAEKDIKTYVDFQRELIRKQNEQFVRDAEEQKLIGEVAATLDAYVQHGEKVLALSRENKNDEAKAAFADELQKYGDASDQAIDTMVDHYVEQADAVHNEMKAEFDFIEVLITSVSALAFVIAGAAMLFTVTGVANPIQRITRSMRRLADGDTETSIPFAGRTDEIGEMAGAVEVFRQAAITNKRLDAEAEENRRQAELDRIASQQRAEAEAAERMRVATSGLAAGLKRLASGDLSFQLNEAFAADFEELRRDFNQSVQQLSSTLQVIQHSVSTMDNGAREMANAAENLSKRTEQQAASLEETAAALDEITANVNSSTRRTEDARAVATQANEGAAKSAGVVASAEEAMRRIEGSSQQISNIIGVIDEIAFQTNLLALNAGVEAARAGEAGKGFAVVAQEVRELAQRSAQAAREIKGLIQNSSDEVENGVKLVRDTGVALQAISGFITEMNQHMDSIATAAKEQSIGLAEVNTAVNSMDQTTQQNAAMVEQSTAASSSLATETAKLRELIGQFRLAAGERAITTASRPVTSAAPVTRPASRPQSAPAPKATHTRGNTALAVDDWEEF